MYALCMYIAEQPKTSYFKTYFNPCKCFIVIVELRMHIAQQLLKNKKQTQLQNKGTHFKILSEYKFEVDTSN